MKYLLKTNKCIQTVKCIVMKLINDLISSDSSHFFFLKEDCVA